MQWIARPLVSIVATVVMAGAAFASERATKEEAIAFANRAVAHWKKNGKDASLAEFNNAKGQFIDRDLYVFALDSSGKTLAHGANPKLIGREMMGLKDPEGKLFIKEMVEAGFAGKPVWVDYKWPNPVTQKLEPKSSYVLKVDDVVLGVGIYK